MSPSEHAKQFDDTIPLAGSKRTHFQFGEYDHTDIPLEADEIPVIIMGSSMVGMFMGLLLGYHGIRSVNFDRHASTAIHPRAALFLLRTIEVLRQLGLDQEFRRESESMFDLNAGMLMVEKLYKGKVLMAMQESDPEEIAKLTPGARMWLTQNMFEPLLRRRAADFGSEQVFGKTVLHYEEDDDGVIVVVQDAETKALKKYRTKYLVAADGNRSATRAKEGIEWHGPGLLSNSISVNFHANLTPYLGERAVHGVTYVNNPKLSGGFRLEQKGQAGFMIVTRAGDQTEFPPDSVTEQEARQYFRDASGIEDDIGLNIDSVSYWSVAAFSSERMTSRKGRTFIMGDAAHVMPPSGGMGGNTGVQDAYNLAWKLAFVLKGWSSPALTKTYDTERVPGAEFTMQQAFTRLVNRVFHGKGYDCKPELPDLVCELGYRYTKGALYVSDGDAGAASHHETEDPHDPLVQAGSKLPHLWSQSGNSKEVSTLDLLKQNMVLITAEDDSPWLDAAKGQKLPIDAHALTSSSKTFRADDANVRAVLKLEAGEALLVRPDAQIAWRAERKESGHQDELRWVLEKIFG